MYYPIFVGYVQIVIDSFPLLLDATLRLICLIQKKKSKKKLKKKSKQKKKWFPTVLTAGQKFPEMPRGAQSAQIKTDKLLQGQQKMYYIKSCVKVTFLRLVEDMALAIMPFVNGVPATVYQLKQKIINDGVVKFGLRPQSAKLFDMKGREFKSHLRRNI